MKFYLIIFILLIFFKWFLYDDNKFKTYFLVGKKGCGKTTDIVKRSLYYQKKGYKCYSNIEIPGNYLFDPKDMTSFKFEPNSVIFLDEVGLLFDARNWKSFNSGYNELFKYFRQYQNIVYMYSQAYSSDLDLKIKNVVDNIIIIHRFGKFSILKPVSKIVDVTNKEGEGGNIIFAFKYQGILSWKFNYIPKYQPFFKSYNPPDRQVINSVNIGYTEFQEIMADNKRRLYYYISTTFTKFKLFILGKLQLPFLKKRKDNE